MSNEEFQVLQPGDIGIAQYFDNFPEYNGHECVVLDGLESRGLIENDMTVKENVLRYRVRFPDNMILGPLPHQLCRKPIPKKQTASNESNYLPDLVAA